MTALGMLAFHAPRAAAQNAAQAAVMSALIDGVVIDTSLAPVANARIAINGTNISVVTGANGRFRIGDMPAGLYIMTVNKVGYRPALATLRLAASDTVRPTYELEPTGTLLGAVKITGKSGSPKQQEFDERRAFGRGKFLTQEEIEAHNSPSPTELFRTFATIDVVAPPDHSASAPEYIAVSKRATGGMGRSQQQKPCYMTVAIDGQPMPTPFNLEQLPPPKDLMGIEVYSGGATMPPQYSRMNGGCGVILVWTKDGN